MLSSMTKSATLYKGLWRTMVSGWGMVSRGELLLRQEYTLLKQSFQIAKDCGQPYLISYGSGLPRGRSATRRRG